MKQLLLSVTLLFSLVACQKSSPQWVQIWYSKQGADISLLNGAYFCLPEDSVGMGYDTMYFPKKPDDINKFGYVPTSIYPHTKDYIPVDSADLYKRRYSQLKILTWEGFKTN